MENGYGVPEQKGWDELGRNKEAVELFDDKEHMIDFRADVPRETQSKKFKGKRVFLFDVLEENQEKILIVSSLRLALKLKKVKPLKGSRVNIRGFGKGTSRDYEVKHVMKEGGKIPSSLINIEEVV